MSIGAAIDVAIGLAFTFLILAMLASGIQEAVAGVFKWRGTYLSRGIDVILSNDTRASFTFNGVRDWLVAHFTQRAGTPVMRDLSIPAAPNLPPPTEAQQAALKQVLSVHQHPLLMGTPTDLPSYIPSRNFSLALLQVLRDGSDAPLIQQAGHTVGDLPDGDLKRILSSFLTIAGGDLDTFRAQVETWFDDAMDRLGGVYKRLTQYMMLIIGLLIAGLFNIDTFHVARTLWDVPADRSAIVASATGIAGQAQMPSFTPAQSLQLLQAQPVPFGWAKQPEAGNRYFTWWSVPGWLITALAVSLGAPFWFDLLQNLSNLRAAGPKPSRADAREQPGGSTPQVATRPVDPPPLPGLLPSTLPAAAPAATTSPQ